MQLGRKILLQQEWDVQKTARNAVYAPTSVGTSRQWSTQSILYNDVGDGATIDFYSDIRSSSIWFKCSSTSGYGCILNLGGTWSGYGIGIGTNFTSNDHYVYLLKNDITWEKTNALIQDTEWHQLVVTWGFNSTSSHYVYLDGNQIFTSTASSLYQYPSSGRLTNERTDLGGIKVFGYSSNDGVTSYFDRLFKNGIQATRLVLWNRQLSLAEVQADYSLGFKLPTNDGSIVHMYSMKPKGDIVPDLVGSWNLSKGTGIQFVGI